MRTARPYIALFGLALIAFWPLVLHPTETLYSDTSDLLAEHLPAKYFLVRSLRETGELPLWNPEQYAGSPFVHDIQVGLFYPPNLPFYFISEPAIGPVASWLVFLHVVLAGWFMYAYARHAGLGGLAAFVAGVGYMLSPRWMLQLFLAGHTVTQGICWLPLVLLCVERAILRKRWTWAIGGGMAYAMLILGTHPQWTFYGSLLIGFWPLRLLTRERMHREGTAHEASLKADFGEPAAAEPEARAKGNVTPAAEPEAPAKGTATPSLALQAPPTVNGEPSRRTLLIRWFLAEATVVLIGIALCAVQLLPTMEAAGESSRARGMGTSWSLDGAKAAATTLIGPIPDRVAEPIHWETRGGIGFTWAVMAVLGARLGGRKALVPTVIALGMLAYVLGGSYFIDRLPGFNTFRLPTRMLLTLAFPVAFLAGLGVQSLGHARAKTVLWMATAFWVAIFVNVGTIDYIAGSLPWRLANRMMAPDWWTYWLVTAGTWSLFLAFGVRFPITKRVAAAVGLMIVDVVIVVLPYPDARPAHEIYPASPIIDYIREHNPNGHRLYDFSEEPAYQVDASLLGPGSPAASVHGVPSIFGYNPLDVARYRQFLAFVADIAELQMAFSGEFDHPVVLRVPVTNRKLFDLLGVRYSITPLGQVPGVPLFQQPVSHCYNFLDLGIQQLPPIRLFENSTVAPRVFLVADAVSQSPETEVLAQLKSLDLRRTATLDGWDPSTSPLPQSGAEPGHATIRSHKPNEIIIDLDGKTAGLLVLTDPWYPGWVCRVDGNEVPIWKADYAFRGVMVPEGAREVVFHFEPQSYRRGKCISLITLAVVGLFFLTVLVHRSLFK